jgi:multidrug resistance efflux pump
MFRSTQSKTDILQRDWRNAWSTYQSRLRLLRLDVDEAKLALESLTAKCNQWRQLADRGAVTVSEVQEAESNLAVAKINLARAEEMLQLYADIETTEPELNPASFDAADTTKPDSSPMPVPDVRDPPLPDATADPLAPQEKAVKP